MDFFFKSQMYDSCAKVPLIIKPAAYGDCGAGVPPCQRQEIVNTVDLFATVLETAGLDWQSLAAATPDIESRSMKELLYRGKAGEAVGRKKTGRTGHIPSWVFSGIKRCVCCGRATGS